MISKVDNFNMVPEDIKELLVSGKGEYIPIGQELYTLHPFGIKKYFELLHFISKYYELYEDIFNNNQDKIDVQSFIGMLSLKLKDAGLIDEFLKTFFPEIPDAINLITYSQFEYILGVIYKLNFLSKPLIKDQGTRLSIHKMKELLGLNLHPRNP